MHTHTYIQRVHDSEPYSGIQGRHECLWTLVDPNMYMRHVDTFPHYSLCFSFSYFSSKRHYHPPSSTIVWHTFPITTASCMTSPSYILLFTQHSPIICKDYFPLVYMYKLSRYYAIFHIDLGPMFPWSICEGNTMTKPQPEMTQGIKSWKGNNVQLVQWISSAYMSTSSKYKKNSPSAVDILRDQAEEAPLHQTQP